HRRRRGTPVDEQRVAVLVAQPEPADVAGFVVELRVEVEATEHQPLVRGVERRQPARRLVDHGVALNQAALVPQARAVVALAGELLRTACGRLEPGMHQVDEALFGRDLPGVEVLVAVVLLRHWSPDLAGRARRNCEQTTLTSG